MKNYHLVIIILQYMFLQLSSCKNPNIEYKPPRLKKSQLFYTTHNSVRQIDVDGNEWTIYYEPSNSSSFYGLEFKNNREKIWFTSSFPGGIFEIEPLYQHYQYNNYKGVLNSNTPSDIETDPSSGLTYIAANYTVYKYNGSNALVLNSINLVNQPFSLIIAKGHLIVAGVSQVSITNLNNMNTALFGNSGIGMAGFMCLSSGNEIFITDPSDNSVKKLTENDLDYAIQDLANSTSITSTFQQVTSGNLLNELPGNNSSTRGPIGIDIKGNTLYVTIDKGTNNPGQIVKIDAITGNQTLLYDNIPGPRDILIY